MIKQRINLLFSTFFAANNYCICHKYFSIMAIYIHENINLTNFQCQDLKILNLLSEVRHLHGILIGKIEIV